ncbi:hypothetical protein ACHAXT_012127 [Thalassiosira profunda]
MPSLVDGGGPPSAAKRQKSGREGESTCAGTNNEVGGSIGASSSSNREQTSPNPSTAITSTSHAGANSSRGGTRKRGREDGRAEGDGGGANRGREQNPLQGAEQSRRTAALEGDVSHQRHTSVPAAGGREAKRPRSRDAGGASNRSASTHRKKSEASLEAISQRLHTQVGCSARPRLPSARNLEVARERKAFAGDLESSKRRMQAGRDRLLRRAQAREGGGEKSERGSEDGGDGAGEAGEKENERPDVLRTNDATTSGEDEDASESASGAVLGGDGSTASGSVGDTPEAERVEVEGGRVRGMVRYVEFDASVASAQLEKQQKLEQKSALERRLSELKSQNGGMRAELHRAANQLALKHRELLEAQGRSEEGRKKLGEFKSRLERAVGVARLLPEYKARVDSLVQQLQEKEARLSLAKGRVLSKLQSAMVRRDDAQHRHELLVKAINTNAVKERSISEDMARIRSEIASDEQDISAAQQTESESKTRVETIELEVSTERTRHSNAVADLESKAKEMVAAKEATARAVEEKKAAMEAKKRQLSEMFAKCNELRKAEGHDTFPEPKWGEEQPPGLDVASVRVRVAAEEKALEAKKAERDVLRKDVAKLDATIASNTAKAVEKRAEAEALMKKAAAAREVEAQRKADTEKMVAEADVECEEVERLRASIGELTATKEAHAEEVKSKLEGERGDVSRMDAEITTTLAEIAAVEKAKSELEEKENAEKQALVAEIAKAKRRAANAKEAYEQAQKKSDNFAALPDDELAMELQQLDEEEKQIVEEANRKRDEMIDEEPVLERVKLDWNSDIPIEEQKEAGMAYMRQHCHDILETARAVRQARVESARAEFFEGCLCPQCGVPWEERGGNGPTPSDPAYCDECQERTFCPDFECDIQDEQQQNERDAETPSDLAAAGQVILASIGRADADIDALQVELMRLVHLLAAMRISGSQKLGLLAGDALLKVDDVIIERVAQDHSWIPANVTFRRVGVTISVFGCTSKNCPSTGEASVTTLVSVFRASKSRNFSIFAPTQEMGREIAASLKRRTVVGKKGTTAFATPFEPGSSRPRQPMPDTNEGKQRQAEMILDSLLNEDGTLETKLCAMMDRFKRRTMESDQMRGFQDQSSSMNLKRIGASETPVPLIVHSSELGSSSWRDSGLIIILATGSMKVCLASGSATNTHRVQSVVDALDSVQRELFLVTDMPTAGGILMNHILSSQPELLPMMRRYISQRHASVQRGENDLCFNQPRWSRCPNLVREENGLIREFNFSASASEEELQAATAAICDTLQRVERSNGRVLKRIEVEGSRYVLVPVEAEEKEEMLLVHLRIVQNRERLRLERNARDRARRRVEREERRRRKAEQARRAHDLEVKAQQSGDAEGERKNPYELLLGMNHPGIKDATELLRGEEENEEEDEEDDAADAHEEEDSADAHEEDDVDKGGGAPVVHMTKVDPRGRHMQLNKDCHPALICNAWSDQEIRALTHKIRNMDDTKNWATTDLFKALDHISGHHKYLIVEGSKVFAHIIMPVNEAYGACHQFKVTQERANGTVQAEVFPSTGQFVCIYKEEVLADVIVELKLVSGYIDETTEMKVVWLNGKWVDIDGEDEEFVITKLLCNTVMEAPS